MFKFFFSSINFIFLFLFISAAGNGAVWDQFSTSQEKYLNQDKEFRAKYQEILNLPKERKNELDRLTRELKRIVSSKNLNKGPYKMARDNVDLVYHGVYSVQRQKLQDKIVSKHLKNNKAVGGKPLVIFTAGVGGVGKGFALEKLEGCGFFKSKYIVLDPDAIKKDLPEYSVNIGGNIPKSERAKVTNFVHKESGYINELIEASVFSKRGSLIIDGTLQDFAYSKSVMEKFKKQGYIVKIIYITAPRATIYKRVAERAEKTGRDVPREVLDSMLVNVDLSVEKLRRERGLVDQFLKIDNGSFPTITSTRDSIKLEAPACTTRVKQEFALP